MARISRQQIANEKLQLLKNQLGDDYSRYQRFTKIKEDPEAPIGNFNDTMIKVGEIHEASRDYTVPLFNLRALSQDNILSLNFPNGDYPGADHSVITAPFSKTGLESLCGNIDISSGYIKKCLEYNKVQFASDNINEWIREKPLNSKIFLRLTEGRVRGVLSNKYTPFDDIEVLSNLKPILSPLNEYDIVGTVVTPDIMKLRFVSRNVFEVGGGDKLSYGFDVSNSRVGLSSLKVTFLIYRHICGNGMLFNGGKAVYYIQRHLGIEKQAFARDFDMFMKNIPELTKDIKAQLETACTKHVSSEDVKNMIDQFKAKKISTAAEEKLEVAVNTQQVSVVWDFTNIITKLAQDYEIGVREKMEVAASQIMQRMIK